MPAKTPRLVAFGLDVPLRVFRGYEVISIGGVFEATIVVCAIALPEQFAPHRILVRSVTSHAM